MTLTSTDQLATDKQVRFIESLVRERYTAMGQPDLVAEALDAYAGITKRDASRLIDKLLADKSQRAASQPKAERQASQEVPEGRYALAGEATDGELEFYQVRYGKSGKWSGFLFLDALVGAPMDGRRRPVRDRNVKRRVLDDIKADVAGAAARFGRETDHCGFCAALLTDRRSVAAGYGEVCAANHGLPY